MNGGASDLSIPGARCVYLKNTGQLCLDEKFEHVGRNKCLTDQTAILTIKWSR